MRRTSKENPPCDDRMTPRANTHPSYLSIHFSKTLYTYIQSCRTGQIRIVSRCMQHIFKCYLFSSLPICARLFAQLLKGIQRRYLCVGFDLVIVRFCCTHRNAQSGEMKRASWLLPLGRAQCHSALVRKKKYIEKEKDSK